MTIEQLFDKVDATHEEICGNLDSYKPMTIKTVEDAHKKVVYTMYKADYDRLDMTGNVINELQYIIDICNPLIPDYDIFKELYSIFNEYGVSECGRKQ